MTARSRASHRPALSAARVFRAAIALADKRGLSGLTMRTLAQKLGVEAMSLYHHVANKDQILDGMVDLVFAEIELPTGAGDWKAALRRRSVSAREALLRHPWALGVLESRANPGPATLSHHDAVIGCLRRAGFSLASTAHAFSAIDSYVYGFVLQELNLPFKGEQELQQLAAELMQGDVAKLYPNLAELTAGHVLQPSYAYGDEFGIGLELVLDGLERMRAAQ